ncbi:hypothetical protein P5673_001543 [Acropora cervicornis]|uniref:Uncharacterized protein n=1 Tax=Acropora cervicornis TaxID=6130 RepID=A0AAD9R697_ACRCE|nr:hypothetical protein P5673_001543 [Acropora cervicornis]
MAFWKKRLKAKTGILGARFKSSNGKVLVESYAGSSTVSGCLPERMHIVVLRCFEVNVVEMIRARSQKY